jgi:hypothetical protein
VALTLDAGVTHRFRATRKFLTVQGTNLPAGMEAELVVTDEVGRLLEQGMLLPQLEDGTWPAEVLPMKRGGCGCGK